MTITLVSDTRPAPAILDCLQRVGSALDEVADVQAVYLSTSEKAAALVELDRLQARLAELQLRVLAVAEDVAASTGARDAAAWLAHETRRDPETARADARLAEALDGRRPIVRAGVGAGDVSVAQARVIIRALDEIPADLDAEVTCLAEKTLVGYAADYAPAQLRRLGRHILDVVAPEVAEAAEAKKLAEMEAHAETKLRLTLRALGDGTTRLSGVLPDTDATRLRIYLESLTSPRVSTSSTTGEGRNPDLDRLPYPRRLGHAFRALLDHLDPSVLPRHGGLSTTLMVTVSLDQLRTDLGTAGLLDHPGSPGADLTADQARRLACGAGIIPVVLGSESEILDLGRAARLFNGAQRKALRLRDGRCRAEGCDAPATWTEAHHLKPWSAGGPTDLANAISLCCFHHHRAHDPAYDQTRLANGDIRFHRRT